MSFRGHVLVASAVAVFTLSATKPAAQAPGNVAARPIDPGGIVLPAESASANETKFAFIAYGDTRGPSDGLRLQPAHREVIDQILAAIPDEERAGFPVRFIV